MIEKMRKYTFVLYHLDYEDFLAELQKLGVVHLIKNTDAKTDTLVKNLELIADFAESVKFLKKLKSEAPKVSTPLSPKMLYNKIGEAREEREQLVRKAEGLKKQVRELEPWGHFDYGLETRIEAQGIKVDFHTCLKNHFKPEWLLDHSVEVINEVGGVIYFVVFYTGEKPAIEADTFSFHHHTLQELENQLAETQERIEAIDEFFQTTAPAAIELFEAEIGSLSQTCEFEAATLQGTSEAEDHLRGLGGWIPQRLESNLVQFLQDKGVIHFASDATAEENPPVSLTNNWFSRLFEPISKMYMLPYYNEFDLTPFLAPFFMLFFGFCNADIVYGLVFVGIAAFLRWKAKDPAIKSIATLAMFLGAASVLMGVVVGSALGFDIKSSALGRFAIIKNNEQIFNVALLLGVIQILFGTFINAIKQARQSGFKYAIAPVGILLFLASLSIYGAGMLKVDITSLKVYAKYLMWIGLALLMLFNNPRKNPLINILGGLWLLYNVVTGFFGDVLSYIRLFALGVSGAILGFVFNSIALQMLEIKIVGPVIFLFIMIFGHLLNIALSSLSAFVHPLRLTFVEFFKNAGFAGPGLEYKPFGNKK